ncbi:MAG: hypothetical protein RIS09_341, partial [Actinomycetota bacterium]
RSAIDILDQAWQGKISPLHIRGRSAFSHWAQVAELAVRKAFDITGIEHLDVVLLRGDNVVPAITRSRIDSSDVIQVRHRDGRSWNVTLEEFDLSPRMVSCGKEPESDSAWRVREITPADNWHF